MKFKNLDLYDLFIETLFWIYAQRKINSNCK